MEKGEEPISKSKGMNCLERDGLKLEGLVLEGGIKDKKESEEWALGW